MVTLYAKIYYMVYGMLISYCIHLVRVMLVICFVHLIHSINNMVHAMLIIYEKIQGKSINYYMHLVHGFIDNLLHALGT